MIINNICKYLHTLNVFLCSNSYLISQLLKLNFFNWRIYLPIQNYSKISESGKHLQLIAKCQQYGPAKWREPEC